MAVDGLDDLFAGGEDGLDVFVQDELKFLQGVEVAEGSLMMILSAPLSCDRGRTTFSRATDSGTSSMTAGGNGDFGEVDELHAVELGDGAS